MTETTDKPEGTEETTHAPSDERVREVGFLARVAGKPAVGAILAVIIVWALFAVVAFDNNFVSMATTAAILNRAAPLGILAVAVALLMIGGEFDLSIGSVLGFSGMALMVMVSPSAAGGLALPLLPALIITLMLAVVAGVANGALVQSTKLPSFIITLAGLFIFRGLAIAIPRTMTNRTQLGGFDEIPGSETITSLIGSSINIGGANFDVAILWWALFVVVGAFVLTRTRAGNWIFGVGGDQEASRNVGVPVTGLKIALFVCTAFAGFFVAMAQVADTGTADSLRGTLIELQAIIAAVVGGVLLTGGYGSVVGAALGALVFSMVQQGIIVTGIDGDWFQVFVGGILILAVIFNNAVRQRAQRR
ncbi:MAG: ABC transporter permease [Acidimicrobiia bacterium]|nr:ABC transporter permease [Acidimicrobiia bacterium]